MREAVKNEPTPEVIVSLVGSPNSGKTTLYNWLTGSKFKTVNYPGATVDYSIGRTHERYGDMIQIMDTPGTYSLDPKSPDERVTNEAIFNHRVHGASTVVVAVADATHLARQLLVTRQLIQAGFPVVLAVTMSDLLAERRETLDTDALAKDLGVPVVLINGRLGGGVDKLVDAIRRQIEKHRKHRRRRRFSHGRMTKSKPLLPLTASWSRELCSRSFAAKMRRSQRCQPRANALAASTAFFFIRFLVS